MKLSIIVCIYNTERQFLDECLQSIHRALPAKTKCEIILVDDGSDKDYGDIADRHHAKYEKLKRGGTLSARLHGIEVSMGEYVAFVDSDDTVGFNYYMPMIKRADEGFDIVINSWAFHSAGTRYVCLRDDTVSGSILSDEPLTTFFMREGRQHSYYVLWNKIYRSDLLKRVARKLRDADAPHPFCFSEDALINLFAFAFAKKICGISSGYYFYRIHGQQTVNATTKEKLLYQVDCMSYTLKKCREMISGLRGERMLSERIDGWTELMASSHYASAKRSGFGDAFSYVEKKYGVSGLKAPRRRDSAVYEKVKLLPESTEKTDIALHSLCVQGGIVRVRRPKRGGYAELLLDGLKLCGTVIEYKRNYPALPKERISLVKRLLFSYPIRRLGALLFKKGSRIRAFLKRFI